MKKRFSISSGAIVLGSLLMIACSSDVDDEAKKAPKDEVEKLEQRLEGQGIALMPFAAGDARCGIDVDATLMDLGTLASCAHLDRAKLAPELVVTDDPRVFDPKNGASILVFVGPTIDGPPESRGWIAAVGLGPLPNTEQQPKDGQLVKSSMGTGMGAGGNIGPRVVFAAPLLIEGGQLLIAAGIAFFGAKAIVATGEAVLNQSQSRPIVEDSQRVITKTSRLINCTPDEHELLKSNKSRACDLLPESCPRAAARIGGGGSLCLGLDSRRNEFQKCKNARQDVTDRCFGGVNDEEHARQISDMDRLMTECDSLLARNCR